MNYYFYPITKIFLQKTTSYATKYTNRFILLISIMLFSISASSQDTTPPELVNPERGCSSLDRVNVSGCYRDEFNFDGNSLIKEIADLYTDPSEPITVSLINKTAGPNNGYCSWSFIYTYKIQDAAGNFVVCDVTNRGNDNILPTFTLPADITIYQNSSCSLNDNPLPAVSGDVTDAADNCGVFSVLYGDCEGRRGTGTNREAGCSDECPGTRIIARTWRVFDSCGNVTEGVQLITIRDTTAPVFTNCPGNFTASDCENVTYTVEATDNCNSQVSMSYVFTGATTGSGSGTGSGSAFLSGVTHVTVTATDDCGNSRDCTFDVTTTCSPLDFAISAGITTTIYSGTVSGVGPYGPQSINLCTNVTSGTAPYTYSWSPEAGLNNPNIANPVASPTETTTYTLRVTDHNGASGHLSITINVLSLSTVVCGGNGNNVKFNVCHVPPGNPANAHNICISKNALNAHLVGGSNGHNNCYLGPCGQQLCFSTNPDGCQGTCGGGQSPTNKSEINPWITDEAKAPAELTVVVSPNPSRNDFNIQVFSKSNEPVTVRILDYNNAVKSVSTVSSKSNSISVGSNLTKGVYVAEVIQGNNRQVVKLIKIN